MQNIVGKWSFTGRFATNDGSTFIKEARNHKNFTERHAILLANHFDDWTYSKTGRFYDAVRTQMNVTGIEPPRENAEYEIDAEAEAKMNKTLADAKAKLGRAGIEV